MPSVYATTTPDGAPVAILQQTSSELFAASQRFRMFVSYRNGSEHEAGHIASRLREFGITTFVASEDLNVGERWAIEIEAAVQNCDALLAYATSNFGSGEWTDREVRWAIRFGKPIYHVAPGVLASGPVAEYQALQLDGGDVPILKIVQHFGQFPRMAESIVYAIERCAKGGSYAQANQLASAFQRLSVLSCEQAQRLIDAYNSDESHPAFGAYNQIRGAFAFGRGTGGANDSLMVTRINELTPLVVGHDEEGKIRCVSSYPPRIRPVDTFPTDPTVGDTFDPTAMLPHGKERVVMARS